MFVFTQIKLMKLVEENTMAFQSGDFWYLISLPSPSEYNRFDIDGWITTLSDGAVVFN